jgi:AcrR family transcriptional regulator
MAIIKHKKRRRTAGKRAGISHEQLVHFAADLADREGVDAVTLARLAQQSGVRTPTVSHHVGSLRQLRSDLALLAVQELTEAVHSACAGKRGREAVRAVYRAYRAYIHAHPGRYAASVEAPDPKDARRLAVAGELTAILKEAFGQIGLQDADAIRAARLLRAAVHGYATLELSDGWQTSLDNPATFDWLLEVIISGLTSNESPII